MFFLYILLIAEAGCNQVMFIGFIKKNHYCKQSLIWKTDHLGYYLGSNVQIIVFVENYWYEKLGKTGHKYRVIKGFEHK